MTGLPAGMDEAAEFSETSSVPADHQWIAEGVSGSSRRWPILMLGLSLQQLPGDITRDFESLGHYAALHHQTGHIFRCRRIQPFGKLHRCAG